MYSKPPRSIVSNFSREPPGGAVNLGRRRAQEVRDTEPNSRDLLETRDPINNEVVGSR